MRVLRFNLLVYSILIVLSFLQCGLVLCHRIYIIPYKNALCLGHFRGDPCVLWSQYSARPAQYLQGPATTLVISRGDYTFSSSISVSNVNNFTVTSEDGARFNCRYRYYGSFVFSNIRNLTIENLSFSDNNHYCYSGRALQLYQTNANVINVSFSQTGIQVSSFSTLIVNKSNFTNYNGNGGEGSIHSDSTSPVTIHNSRFSNCHAGAVYAEGELIVVNSIFTNNRASYYGGAVYVRNKTTIINTSFINNRAGSSGGALYQPGAFNLTIMSCNFSTNTMTNINSVDSKGGAIYSQSTSIFLLSSTFVGNTAYSCGVTCIGNATVFIINCTFISNMATTDAGVFNMTNSSVTVINSSFIENAAVGNGGVMYTYNHPTRYMINNTLFIDNKASNGGVMFVRKSSSYIGIMQSRFIGNTATSHGGVFDLRGVVLAVDIYSQFLNNTATYGDVISACFSEITVYGLEIQPDPQYPQYCFVYNESVIDIVTHSDINTIPKESTATDIEVSLSYLPVIYNTNITVSAITDVFVPDDEGKNYFKIVPVTYTSMAISLVSLAFSITVAVCGMVVLCSIFKKRRLNGPYNLEEVRMTFSDNEYTFDVEDSPDHASPSHS